jgi:HD-like signal output (HDOD) protein
MPLVTISSLKNGMVLAEDVVTPQGRFLLAKGTVIRDKQIRIIKMWGVSEILVEGEKEEQVYSLSEGSRSLKTETEYTDRLFAPTDPYDPVIRELKKICLIRRVNRKMKMVPLFQQGWHGGGEYPAELPHVSSTISKADIVENNVNLASFPAVYKRIVDVLEDPKSSASNLADAVSKDSSLTGKLLKLVNSSLYGFSSEIDSITKAITIIGFKELGTLAVGIVVIRAFRQIPAKVIDMKNFWLHSLGCGIIAKIIARKKFDSGEEQFFIAGLLHDIGRLILLKDYPEVMTKIIVDSRQKQLPLYSAEQEILGFDHTDILELLLPVWNFPANLQQIINYHHSPKSSRSSLRAAVVHAADAMTNAFEIGSSAEYFVPPISSDLWRSLGLSEGSIESIITQADRQIDESVQVFFE